MLTPCIELFSKEGLRLRDLALSAPGVVQAVPAEVLVVTTRCVYTQHRGRKEAPTCMMHAQATRQKFPHPHNLRQLPIAGMQARQGPVSESVRIAASAPVDKCREPRFAASASTFFLEKQNTTMGSIDLREAWS